MVNSVDPGGNYPVTDDIEPQAYVNTPAGYDLTTLLSEPMRERQQWLDMAASASRILYNYIESQRISLELSRDPQHISRALKISLLKMMGLDWNSDLLTDDDYDRMLESVSLYNMNHGSNDFVNYMGYSLGLPLELVPLWTTNYTSFSPAPQEPSIFDSPPGPWYPTSHVALLYEQYAANASDADAAVLQEIFYKMAPINLVLEWVGTVVTLNVGTLWMGTVSYEKSIDTAILSNDPVAPLYYDERCYEKEIDTVILQPDRPDVVIITDTATWGFDVGMDGTFCVTPGINWTGYFSLSSAEISVVGGFSVPSLANDNSLTEAEAPASNWTDPTGMYTGLLTQPNITLLLSSSGSPNYSTWLPTNSVVTQTFIRYDGLPGYSVNTTLAGGSILSSSAGVQSTDMVVFTFMPNVGTTQVAFSRGTDKVTVVISSLSVSATSGVIRSGAYSWGESGWITLWAEITGDAVTVYPAGTTYGGVSWLDCQIISGGNYTLPLPSTVAAQGSFDTLTVTPYLGTGDFNFSGGPAEPSPPAQAGSGGAWFGGGVAEVSLPALSTQAAPSNITTLLGTQITLGANETNQPYGNLIIRATNLHQEWVLDGPQTLAVFQDIAGNTITVTVDYSSGNFLNITSTYPGFTVAPYAFTEKQVNFGIQWSPGNINFFLNGVLFADLSLSFPSNLSTIALLSNLSSASTSTWVLEQVFVLSAATAALLPTTNYMLLATTPTVQVDIVGVQANSAANKFGGFYIQGVGATSSAGPLIRGIPLAGVQANSALNIIDAVMPFYTGVGATSYTGFTTRSGITAGVAGTSAVGTFTKQDSSQNILSGVFAQTFAGWRHLTGVGATSATGTILPAEIITGAAATSHVNTFVVEG